MDLSTAVSRAKRGMREDVRLYILAVSSLAVAFLCLAGAILFVQNLDNVAERWGKSGRMTIYLRDGARDADVDQLKLVLEGLREVQELQLLSGAAARQQFLAEAEVGSDLAALPPDVFPASVELTLAGNISRERILQIADKVKRFPCVEDVETYRGWFDKLDALLATGRSGAGVVALLVLICVLAVVGNTIRLSVAGRRAEIEVLKLCGATDGFVRGPFVIEGAIQGFAAAAVAVAILCVGFFVFREHVDATLAALAGVRVSFLSPWVALAMVLGGGMAGALGSALSLRRYLAI